MQNAPSYMFDRVIKTPLKALAQKYILVTAQNLKFPLRISLVNVTKAAGNCGFGHIY